MSGCQVGDCDQPATHRARGATEGLHRHLVEQLACLEDVGRAVDTLHDRGVTAVTVDPYVEPS